MNLSALLAGVQRLWLSSQPVEDKLVEAVKGLWVCDSHAKPLSLAGVGSPGHSKSLGWGR